MNPFIRWFDEVGSDDVGTVGGKNASLGEMTCRLRSAGVRVPEGFALTVAAYHALVDANRLEPLIRAEMEAYSAGTRSLRDAAGSIRARIERAEWPADVSQALRDAYRRLAELVGNEAPAVAARSSATAEDLPGASFAGQLESFLNVRGEAALLEACRRCVASLFTDRVIAYREARGFDHMQVGVSVGVQRMVRSDQGGAGVMFSIDPESGFPRVIVINAAWGLGETVVRGSVDPDEYVVFKPLLDHPGRGVIDRRLGGKAHKLIYDEEGAKSTVLVETSAAERGSFVLETEQIARLARWALSVEEHYGGPMDMEWARDGADGELFMVQARPETVHARAEHGVLRRYVLASPPPPLLEGLSVGQSIAVGPARIVTSAAAGDDMQPGEILVTEQTSPDWMPLMRRAGAVVTDRGGRTSHAAIVSRELGVPAVIGTGRATTSLHDGQEVTVSCAAGSTGYVYEGRLPFETQELRLDELPQTRTEIMMTIASPEAAFDWWKLPAAGIGLARMEFVIDHAIRVHPLALIHFDELEAGDIRAEIEVLTAGYDRKADYFVDRLAAAIARIAAARYPGPVLVRTSDFKSNEYAGLLGGQQFEPVEANPMLGVRGASRYYSGRYREGFALECEAIRRVRLALGLDNVRVMIPFCRTPEEADRVLEVMAEAGLSRGVDGLQIYMMSEIPSNVLLADEFAARFDGFSIGSNDLTQLTLGVDRDSAELRHLFDEDNPAVRRLIRELIDAAHRRGIHVGLCGQAPSDRPAFAAFLVEAGIDSISVQPDRVVEVTRVVAETERRLAWG